jgi:hypothetical protein
VSRIGGGGGGGVQYDILEILNFVGGHSRNLLDKHSKLFSLKTIAFSNIKYSLSVSKGYGIQGFCTTF